MRSRLLAEAALVGLILAGLGERAAADPYVVVASPPSPTAGYTMGGYEYNLGGGILVQMLDGAGNVVSGSHPLPISGSFSSSISGFTPNGTFATPMVANGTSSEIALPAGTVDLITNVGTATVFVNLGTSAAVTATTSATPIAPGGAFPVTLSSFTNIAAITASGTTTLNISGGAGLFTGLGGIGAAGGGGGGTVTQGPQGTNTSPWFVSPGTSTFPVSGTVSVSGTTTVSLPGGAVVSGTVTAIPGAGTGTVVVGGASQPPLTGTSTFVLNSAPTVNQGVQGTNTSPWFVSPGTSTFPVSGTVTAIPGAGTGTVLNATGTNTMGTVGVYGTVTSVPSGTQVITGVLTGTSTVAVANTPAVTVSGTATTTEPNVNANAGSTSTQVVNIQQIGAGNLGTGQVACGTTATVIVAARAARQLLIIENVGTGTVFIGGTAVTTAGGMLLPPIQGASQTIPTTMAVDCIATATDTISYMEVY